MKSPRIGIKRVNPLAVIPEYATTGSAGVDLRACFADQGDKIVLRSGDAPRLVGTGIAFQMPAWMLAKLYVRSSMGHKLEVVLGNGTGIIDSDYQGEVMASLVNRGNNDVIIRHGDRIAQLVFQERLVVQFEEIDEFAETTERGAGGFGSTGVA